MNIPCKLHPEMEITGELYYRLRKKNVGVKLEVSFISDFHKSSFMRVDLACFHKKNCYAVIECKRRGKSYGDGRQKQAYEDLAIKYGLKVYFVNDMNGIKSTILDVLEIRKKIITGEPL